MINYIFFFNTVFPRQFREGAALCLLFGFKKAHHFLPNKKYSALLAPNHENSALITFKTFACIVKTDSLLCLERSSLTFKY